MNIFGKRLRYLRESRNIMGKDLASELKVDPATISNWENGNRFPKEAYMSRIANYFNVSVDYLIGKDIGNDEFTNIPFNNTIYESQAYYNSTINYDKINIISEIQELINKVEHSVVVELGGVPADDYDLYFIGLAFKKLLLDVDMHRILKYKSK